MRAEDKKTKMHLFLTFWDRCSYFFYCQFDFKLESGVLGGGAMVRDTNIVERFDSALFPVLERWVQN